MKTDAIEKCIEIANFIRGNRIGYDACEQLEHIKQKVIDLKNENKILKKDYEDIRKIMNEECNKKNCPYIVRDYDCPHRIKREISK